MSVNSFSGQPAIPASYGFTAGKNKIINGDFGIWQRGTSFTPAAATATYTADRMRTICAAGTTVSRQTFTAGSAPVAGYEGAYYLNQTITANNQNYEFQQNIEDVRTFAGQTVTLSFWARSTVGAQPLNVALIQYFGTGGSPSASVSTGPTSGSPYTPTSSWVRYSFTFNVPSISGKTIGTNNDSYLWVRLFQYTTTATNTSIDLWGVQLEAGATATSFQTATGTVQGELAACQRYYVRFANTSNANATVVPSGIAYSATTFPAVAIVPVTLRTNPTSVEYSNLQIVDSGFSQYTVTNVAISQNGNPFIICDFTASGMTAGRAGWVRQSSTSGYLAFNAEL